jgi:hypothetical protein
VSNDSRHPPILIAISWQALNRALSGRADTTLCDCTVVILFAGFYLEADLNDLIQRLGRTREMRASLKKQTPGLGDKLASFYNEYVARVKASVRTTSSERECIGRSALGSPASQSCIAFGRTCRTASSTPVRNP